MVPVQVVVELFTTSMTCKSVPRAKLSLTGYCSNTDSECWLCFALAEYWYLLEVLHRRPRRVPIILRATLYFFLLWLDNDAGKE